MKAKYLQDDKYTFLQNSQDINALCDYYPILDRENITGAIVLVEDGEYSEVYITESNRPYELEADYITLDEYSENLKN